MTSDPLVITDAPVGHRRVLDCNDPAQRLGVRPGMSLQAAYALAPTLRAHALDPAGERSALERIAAWAGQFTPRISLAPGEGLLLEVEGSLALYGTLADLRQRICQGLEGLGYRTYAAVAPTPTAAWWLARAGEEVMVTATKDLARQLARLPLAVLRLPAAALGALQGLGLRWVGECLGLPRDALARRFGPELPAALDRALGRAPDPRPPYRPPAYFEASLSLPTEVSVVSALLFGVHRLLLELSGFLGARGGGVQRLGLHLFHQHPPSTRVSVGLMTPSRDAAHLLSLVRERLERIELPQPVREIGLTAQEILPLPGRNLALFRESAHPGEDWPHLVERLRARLGVEAVRGLCSVAEHRPERAWRYCAPGESGVPFPCGARPLWLLPAPVSLAQQGERPALADLPLTLQRGPERIESGWWDGQGVTRDYFVAHTPQGERFWIYRERAGARGWFLHGIFG